MLRSRASSGGSELTPERIADALTTYVVLLFSLSFHESAHAWVAHKMGDDTALEQGRVSLNPLVHIDPVGTVLMPLLQVLFSGIPLLAWAKPTPVVARNFRNVARGQVLTAGAGPVSNVILAVVFSALFVAAFLAGPGRDEGPVTHLLLAGVQMNVVLAVFNLLPLPPLDGSWIASFGLPRGLADSYDRIIRPYGSMILLALVVTGVLRYVIGPVLLFVQAAIASVLVLLA